MNDFEKEVFLKDKVVLVDGSWDYAKAKNSMTSANRMQNGRLHAILTVL